ILSGICEPYCLITPDLTMRYCPILILIDYMFQNKLGKVFFAFPMPQEHIRKNETPTAKPVNPSEPLRPFFRHIRCSFASFRINTAFAKPEIDP
ncbi:hypothetical protein, partial [Neisseria mucosa]|uniref:hypothetical protein n=1 Tax=Neisseria mucosa TaxID=488 RepID=UPI00280BBC98